MAPRTDRILWLDLETTGSAPTSEVLEVGVAITDSSLDLNVIDTAKFLVKPSSLAVFDGMDPVVQQMHSDNRLSLEIHLLYDQLPVIDEVDHMLVDFLKENLDGTSHIPLAGSGVAHFDRPFIKRDFPLFDKRLSYWAYDVGVIRRFFHLVDIDITVPIDGIVKTHRALDDVYAHIAEMRKYMDVVTTWEKQSRVAV